jgi:orotidine-5'-phosphate decarboxylase
MIAQVGGHILAPGVGAQGAGPKELRQVFGGALGLVLATASRSIAAAGPDPSKLAARARECAEAVSFLGN